MLNENQKTVLITGCSSGIGLCAAKELQDRGYRVFATVRKEEDLRLLQFLGFEVEKLDLTDSCSMDQAVENILQKTGGHLDALINNAGYLHLGAVEDLSLHTVKEQFETNFFGTLYLTNKVIPIMRKQKNGRIIFISSINGLIAVPNAGAYCASKFALEGLVESLAMELHQSPLHVSLIQPGLIATDLRRTATCSTDEEKLPFIESPKMVISKIVHALEAKRPKFRYRVTAFAHFLSFIKHVLPDRMQIKIMSKMCRL